MLTFLNTFVSNFSTLLVMLSSKSLIYIKNNKGHNTDQCKSKFHVLDLDLTRLPSRTTSSRWQVDKEAIGLSRVQQFSHLCVARPYQISVNFIFKHSHY